METHSYEQRQEDWKKREDVRTVKLAEVRGRVTQHIKQNDEVRVRIERLEELRFKSPVDIKNGDTLRITIEKV